MILNPSLKKEGGSLATQHSELSFSFQKYPGAIERKKKDRRENGKGDYPNQDRA